MYRAFANLIDIVNEQSDMLSQFDHGVSINDQMFPNPTFRKNQVISMNNYNTIIFTDTITAKPVTIVESIIKTLTDINTVEVTTTYSTTETITDYVSAYKTDTENLTVNSTEYISQNTCTKTQLETITVTVSDISTETSKSTIFKSVTDKIITSITNTSTKTDVNSYTRVLRSTITHIFNVTVTEDCCSCVENCSTRSQGLYEYQKFQTTNLLSVEATIIFIDNVFLNDYQVSITLAELEGMQILFNELNTALASFHIYQTLQLENHQSQAGQESDFLQFQADQLEMFNQFQAEQLKSNEFANLSPYIQNMFITSIQATQLQLFIGYQALDLIKFEEYLSYTECLYLNPLY